MFRCYVSLWEGSLGGFFCKRNSPSDDMSGIWLVKQLFSLSHSHDLMSLPRLVCSRVMCDPAPLEKFMQVNLEVFEG